MSDALDKRTVGNRRVTFWKGAGAATLVLTVLYSGLMWLNGRTGVAADIITIPSLFLIPVGAGISAAFFWRELRLSGGETALYSLFTTIVGCLGAAIFLGEGAVCLVIGFPLLFVAILAGALLGRVWFRTDRTGLQISIAPLFAVLLMGEVFSRSNEQSVVVDELLINAPPSKVWPHLLAFSEIEEPPGYWIFRLGLPYPEATTNGGNFVGADRQCIFSDGIVIKEKIVEFVPEKRLTFDIVEQVKHPEAYGHITLQRGQFDLRDNGNGTTTLIGTSWYTLHVRPLAYFDWWTRDMTRAVHFRVMKHIQRKAEG